MTYLWICPRYYLMCGWQGLRETSELGRQAKRPGCTDGIRLAPPYNRAQVILARAALLEWAAGEFSRMVRLAEDQIREKIPKGARMKESLNHRDLHGVGTLQYSRFMLSLLGIIRSV